MAAGDPDHGRSLGTAHPVGAHSGRAASGTSLDLRRPADGLADEPRALRAACSQAVGESLRAAGLLAPDIRPRSITAWVGAKAIEQGACIDEVARRLGMRSLDQTAELVGLRWREGQA